MKFSQLPDGRQMSSDDVALKVVRLLKPHLGVDVFQFGTESVIAESEDSAVQFYMKEVKEGERKPDFVWGDNDWAKTLVAENESQGRAIEGIIRAVVDGAVPFWFTSQYA